MYRKQILSTPLALLAIAALLTATVQGVRPTSTIAADPGGATPAAVAQCPHRSTDKSGLFADSPTTLLLLREELQLCPHQIERLVEIRERTWCQAKNLLTAQQRKKLAQASAARNQKWRHACCKQGASKQGQCEERKCEQAKCEPGKCEQAKCEPGKCEQDKCEQDKCEPGKCEQKKCGQGACRKADDSDRKCCQSVTGSKAEEKCCDEGDSEGGSAEEGEQESGQEGEDAASDETS
ncbi:MAG: hypothetical protein ACC645_05600 [Pirellulales bacterium]